MHLPERDFWYSDPEPEPPDDGPCYFWDGERCHYEMLVTGVGGPCADCPEEQEAIASLDRK